MNSKIIRRRCLGGFYQAYHHLQSKLDHHHPFHNRCPLRICSHGSTTDGYYILKAATVKSEMGFES